MRTVYLDIYFLINLSVDVLACYLCTKLLRIRASVRRLLLVGVAGGLLASCAVILESVWIDIFGGVLFYFISSVLIARGASLYRRLCFSVYLLVVSTTLGGAVFLFYGMLENVRDKIFADVSSSPENKRAIILALSILIIIGAFRLFMLFFSDNGVCESARLGVKIGEIYFECEALVDSGNLVKDPMSLCPVMFIKKSTAEKYLPKELTELTSVDSLDRMLQKRIRLIPMTVGGKTRVAVGLRTDYVKHLQSGEELELTVAIDKEEGSFGGYCGLVPAVALKNCVRK